MKSKAIVPLLTFAARHLIVVFLSVVAGCVCWTLAYLILLLFAIFGNQGLGGPLAYPAGLVAIVTACLTVGCGVFAPASACGTVFCALFRLPKLAAIPVVFVSALLLSHLLCWIWFNLATSQVHPSFWTVLKNFTWFLSVPLGIYWWLTEGPGAIVDAIRRLLANRRRVLPQTGGNPVI